MDPPIDPAVFEQREMRQALAAHDIGTAYRLLKRDGGISQRRIAELTGTSQSQVSEILHGRRVLGYDVLERIADGLGVPRGLMGLSYGPMAPTLRTRRDNLALCRARRSRRI